MSPDHARSTEPTTTDGDRSRPGATSFLLAQVGAQAATRFAGRIAPLGVDPADVGILRMIAADPGRSQRSLARELGVVGSRVVVLIDLLEGKGLVERRNNPRDRRLHALHLTDQGQHVLDKVRSLRAAHEDDICAALDTTQRAQLNRLLRAIADQQGLSPGVHPGYRERSR